MGPTWGPPSSRPPSQARLSAAEVDELLHDLRQGLSTILVVVAAAEPHEGTPAPVRARLTEVANLARHLNVVCNQAARRREREPSELARALTRFDEFATEVVEPLRAGYRGTLEVAAEPVRVVVDRVGVRRAITNLLDNACRAAGPGGHVRLAARRHSSALVIDVDDDGPGFGNAPPGQCGMGLTIAGRVAGMHEGKLTISHLEPAGSRVSLRLPVLAPDDARPSGRPRASSVDPTALVGP